MTLSQVAQMVDFIPQCYSFSIREIFSQKDSNKPIPCRDRVCWETMHPFFMPNLLMQKG